MRSTRTPNKPDKHSRPMPSPRATKRKTKASRRIDFRSLRPGLWLFLLALVAYLPTLRNGYVWDDSALTANPLVRYGIGLWKIWTAPSLLMHEQHYWPLVYSSFWLEHAFVGFHPLLYHLDNILLHALAAFLLWRVLAMLAMPGAWLAAALFAVHPVHVESVAWVIERKDVLSGAFYFASILAFLHWERERPHSQPVTAGQSANALPQDEDPLGNRKLYLLALGLFAAALLSKSVVVGLPLVLVLILWWQHGRLTRRDLLPLVPFFLLAVLLTLADLNFVRAQSHGGETSGLALPERVQMAGRSIWVYLSKLAWPYPLATFYPQWTVNRAVLAFWLPLVAWLALLAALWFARRRIGRGPCVTMLFYSITLGPALGVMDFDFLCLSWVADRFQYLASAGPIVLAAAGLTLLAGRLNLPAASKRYGSAVLLALLGILCFRQAIFYHDSVTLFRASAAAYPHCWPAYTNLCWALTHDGKSEEAVRVGKEALEREVPREYRLAFVLAQILEQMERYPEAEKYYKEMLDLKSDFDAGRIRYGAFLAARQRVDEALALYRQALKTSPDNAAGLNDLGLALRAQNKLDEAEASMARAVELNPRFVAYRANLALALFDQQKIRPAIEQCETILQYDPDNYIAHMTLGQAWLAEGNGAAAFPHFEAAVRLDPRSPEAVFLLGEACFAVGNNAAAVQHYQKALTLRPGFPEALTRLKSLEAPEK